ncbi:ESPR-type extended signal peptide-containing protein, partial [Pyramidobacter sp.]|uniref:ESPR-type extended signal peptide-containing protein n=2 Tax=unclassified Pyramidobacter TaxID=2632171 RepID=UPI00331D53F8
MNRIFRVIWNKVRGCYVVASEIARIHGKSPSRASLRGVAAAAGVVAAMLASLPAVTQASTIWVPTSDDTMVEPSGTNNKFPNPVTQWTNTWDTGNGNHYILKIVGANGINVGLTNTFDINYTNGNNGEKGYTVQKKTLTISVDPKHLVHYYSVNTVNAGNLATGAGSNYANDGAKGQYSLAVGLGARSDGRYSIAFGKSAATDKTGAYGVAIGRYAKVTGGTVVDPDSNDPQQRKSYGIAIGDAALSSNNSTVALGDSATALGDKSVSMGRRATVVTGNSIALGNESMVTVEAGNNEFATYKTVTVPGNFVPQPEYSEVYDKAVKGTSTTTAGATATAGTTALAPGDATSFKGAQNNVTYQLNEAVASSGGALSIGNGGENGNRRIQNVAAGQLSDTSTDAVNGAQLYAVMTKPITVKGNENNASGTEGGSDQILGSILTVRAAGDVRTEGAFTGKNLKTCVVDGTVALGMADSPEFTKVILGDDKTTHVDSSGLTIGDGAKFTNEGVDAGNQQIAGVASGGAVDTNAANIGDVNSRRTVVSAGSNVYVEDASQPGDKNKTWKVSADKATVKTAAGEQYLNVAAGEADENHVTDYTVSLDAVKLGKNIDISNNTTITNLDNRVTTNTSNITNNTSNITKLQGGFDLKAGSTTSNVALGGATAPTVEFLTADDTMTIGLSGTKVTYGIDKTKLVQNITGDVINQINNTTSNPVTNIEGKFKVSDGTSANTKTLTISKSGVPEIQFKGETNKIAVEVAGTDSVPVVTVKADPNLGQNIDISNNTSITNLSAGFNVKAGANTGAIQAGNTLEFAGKNYVEAEYDSTAKKMTIGLDDATKNKIDNLSTTINNASKWTIKDGETPAGEKEINSTTPLVVKGENGVTTKVDTGGLTIGLDGSTLSSTINNSSTVITNVQAKFKIAGDSTGPQEVTVDKTGTQTVKFAGDGNIIESEVGTSGVKYKVNTTNLNTAINNQIANNLTIIGHTTDINALKAGFTVSNEAGTKQDITLGGASKKNIQFKGETNKILVEVANASDGATVTVKADPNLGQHIDISNNNAITTLSAGFNVKAGANTGAIQAGNTLEFAGKNYVEVEYDSTAKKMTIGLDDATKNKIDNLSTTINNASKWTIKDGETPAGEKEINSTTPLVVKGANGVTTKVDAGGLTIGLNGANLSNTINNSSTVINNVEAKFKIADTGTGTKTIT